MNFIAEYLFKKNVSEHLFICPCEALEGPVSGFCKKGVALPLNSIGRYRSTQGLTRAYKNN